MKLFWRKDRDVRWLFRRSCDAIAHPLLLSQRASYSIKRSVSDVAAMFGYYDYPYRIMFLAGMALSGSTWIKNMLGRVPGYYARTMPMPVEVSVRQDIQDSAFSRVPKRGYSFFKTHLNPTQDNLECLKRNGVWKIIVSYRDLRDVAISDYYRRVEFPEPFDVCGSDDYDGVEKGEALLRSVRRVATHFVPWIRGWFQIAAREPTFCHFVKYEDLKRDTRHEFQKILSFYKISLDEKVVDGILHGARGRGDARTNIAAADVLPWAYSSNFRKGVIGSWRKEFDEVHIVESRNLLGAALVELGYE